MILNRKDPFLIVLGIAQDGGVPHAGCRSDCCKKAWSNKTLQHLASCLGIMDPVSNEYWMIDATPDFKWQLHDLQCSVDLNISHPLNGILLTHGHVGHYAGLINLEKAVMNIRGIPVFAMLQMHNMLSENLPWKSMVDRCNIELKLMQDKISFPLNERITITPLLVPHRDEFTETVGFIISTNQRKVLYIPDIDNWDSFIEIDKLFEQADIVMIDGTFFSSKELKGRDMRQVPHPTIETSMQRFEYLPKTKKENFYFIHLNHTNPCLNENSEAYKTVISQGFNIASEGLKLEL